MRLMKIAIVASLLTMSAVANGSKEGYAVYKSVCAACHVELMSAKEAVKNMDKISAPPMVEVSQRLKKMIKFNDNDEEVQRELVLTFMRDYIINPSIDKSMCRLGAIDKFDVMPSLKGQLTEKQIKDVTEWVYDRYEGVTFE